MVAGNINFEMSLNEPILEKAKAFLRLAPKRYSRLNSSTPTRERYEAIIGGLEPTLMSAARRMCQGDQDRALDLVQDTVVKAYQAYMDGRFEDGTNAKAWILRILTNIYINEYRRRRRWGPTVEIDALQDGANAISGTVRAAQSDMPGHDLFEVTVDENLEQALSNLSTGIRLCIQLVDVEGLDYAEAASALQIPIGTVRSRLSRGRAQLYKALYTVARENRWVKQ